MEKAHIDYIRPVGEDVADVVHTACTRSCEARKSNGEPLFAEQVLIMLKTSKLVTTITVPQVKAKTLEPEYLSMQLMMVTRIKRPRKKINI